MKRKLLSIFLTLCMMLTLLPTALAASVENCTGGDTCTTHAAAIGETHYDTLAEAVDAVSAEATEATTITLLKDCEGAGLMLTGGDKKNIAIDFAGKTYTVNSLVGNSTTQNQAMHFEKGNAVTLQNGTLKIKEEIASNAKILIQNYCALKLTNMVLDGRNIAKTGVGSLLTLSNNGQTSVFTNCTVYAPTAESVANKFAIDSSVWGNYTDTDVTVDNCTVYGRMSITEYKEVDGNYVLQPGVAVNENGKPCITIKGGSFTDIASAVKYAADGATIKLADKVTVNCPVTATDGTGAIEITKNLTIDGDGKTITAGTGFTLNGGSTRGEFHMFNIKNNANVTIQNLTINGNKSTDNAVRSGINLYGAGTVNINNVTVNNCSTYGVTVNGSTAVINGLTTSGNTWGGVNVDNRETAHTSSLTINSCNLGEEYVVFENDKGGSLTASLTGGTYKGIYVNVGEGITVNVSVTGGTFSTDPSTYVASDYIVRGNSDSTYTVVKNENLGAGTYLSQPNVASGYYAVSNSDGTYTVYKYSSGGSSSSSSSNTSSSTVKNPDGSTTTTTTNKTTGTTTEVTKNTDGSVDTVTTNKDGSTTETTQTSNGTTATVETNKQGEVTDISASVSASAAREASKSGESVTLPVEGIEPVSASADAPEINVSIPSNSSSVTVEIPVENVTPGTVVVIVNEDGTETIVPTSKVTENGIEVTLTENATIKVVDNSKSFSDVPSDNVFSDEIASMSARGIMVGKEDGSFDVHGSVTLNQIANVAGRVSGAVPTEDYEGGIAWGEANGLATGDAPATRGQVILALYAAAGSPDTMDTGKLSAYSDGAGVPSEMLSAVLWAVEHGILKGTDVGTLDLGANVTRGQAAAFAGRALNAIG